VSLVERHKTLSKTSPAAFETRMSFLPVRVSVFFVLIGLASCHNILVFMPFGSHSHKATLIPLIQGLLEYEIE
jgi:hypothetical protein